MHLHLWLATIMIVCADDHLLLSIKWGYRNKQPLFTGFWKGSMRLNLVGIETKKLDIKQIISIWSAMRSQCKEVVGRTRLKLGVKDLHPSAATHHLPTTLAIILFVALRITISIGCNERSLWLGSPNPSIIICMQRMQETSNGWKALWSRTKPQHPSAIRSETISKHLTSPLILKRLGQLLKAILLTQGLASPDISMAAIHDKSLKPSS